MANFIKRENLKIALKVAIDNQTKFERNYHNVPNFKSGLVKGWEDVLDHLSNGENIIIKG